MSFLKQSSAEVNPEFQGSDATEEEMTSERVVESRPEETQSHGPESENETWSPSNHSRWCHRMKA